MPPLIATLIFIVGIVGLFALDRGREAAEPSKALWIPVSWLFLVSSRPVSQWLGLTSTVSRADIYLEGSPVDRAVFMLLLALGLVVILRRWKHVAPLLRASWPILLFFVYAGFSILWSGFPFVTFKHWTKGIGDMVMVLVVLTDPDPVGAIKGLLSRLGFVLVPLSILFIKYYPNLGRSYNPWSWTYLYCGVATTKNMLGMACLILGLGSLWRFLGAYQDRGNARRSQWLVAHGAIVTMVLWLLWRCNSVTSVSCFLMAGALMIFVSWRSFTLKSSTIHCLVAAMLGLALYATILNPGVGLVQDLGRDPTLTGRTDLWQLVLSLNNSRWVGSGYESFWLGKRLQQVWNAFPGIQEAHNGYLEIFLNLGWIGVGLLTVIIAKGYRTVITALRMGQNTASLRLAYFVAAVVYSLTEAGFRMMAPIWIMFLLTTTDTAEVNAWERSVPLETKRTDRSGELVAQLGHAFGHQFGQRIL